MASEVTWRKDRPPVDFTIAFQKQLADAPEWTTVQLDVSYPPDGSTPPHKHGGANVFAYVIEGEVLSGMNDEEAKVYKPGESWFEPPGCLHRVSDNNSKTGRARFIATFVIKTETLEKHGPDVLVQIEPEYLEQMKQ